jgi:hypothetical protein
VDVTSRHPGRGGAKQRIISNTYITYTFGMATSTGRSNIYLFSGGSDRLYNVYTLYVEHHSAYKINVLILYVQIRHLLKMLNSLN